MVNLKLFKKICQLSQPQLFDVLTEFLKKHYDNVIIKEGGYIIAEGQLPVALVAHLDTVGQFPPRDIYHDVEQSIMWSPQLLGADDRAGVFAIVKIVNDGYRPYIILTCDEEIGCVGASKIVNDFNYQCPWRDLKAIIQLDRRGHDDAVYYDCNNQEFEKFINSYGFSTADGTFSDISAIAPAFGVAAVNLSIGYLNEHSNIETLNTMWMEDTIIKVKKIISDIDSYKKFKYVGGRNPLLSLMFPNENTCAICNKPLTKNNKIMPIDRIPICKKCFKEYY